MRNRLTITVSNIRGARQLTLHVAMVRLMVALAILALLSLLGGVALVGWLAKTVAALQTELVTLDERKQAVIADYQRALEVQSQRVSRC